MCIRDSVKRRRCDVATIGFWPVKNRLKEVIDYAENPDKTIDKKYVVR